MNRRGTNIYPNSAGRGRATVLAPAGATDCHMHLFDARLPTAPGGTAFNGDATIDDYLKIRARLALSRTVVVQPSTYGADNRLLLAGLHRLGGSGRGVVVIKPDVSARDLRNMHEAGVRGLRINLVQAGTVSIDMIEDLARKAAPLGWHCQFNVTPTVLADTISLFERLPVPVVLDHSARLFDVSAGDPAVSAVRSLMLKGNTWVKMTAACITGTGRGRQVEAALAAARLLLETPDRVLWGSDWPHATASDKPDDAFNFDLLVGLAESEAVRRKILVDNPAVLYQFPEVA